MIASFLAELYRRNRILALVGWLHVLLTLATAIGWIVDDRLVLGANTWIKPFKFMLSLSVYLWTIAWISDYVRRPAWAMPAISGVIATVIVFESAMLLLQAARATTSHFNVTTAFDAAVFQTMGIMIGIDMVMSLLILLLFLRPSVSLPGAYLWGIRAGLLLFLCGGAIGGIMIANNAHTVGAPDGGPGLPVLGWSTVAGDLRVAHGVALHALQVLPLIGFAVSRWSATEAARLAAVGLAAGAYAGGVFVLYRQAITGNPLF